MNKELLIENKIKCVSKQTTRYDDNGEIDRVTIRRSIYNEKGNKIKFNDNNKDIEYLYNDNDLLIACIENGKLVRTYSYDFNNKLIGIYIEGRIKKIYDKDKNSYYIYDNQGRLLYTEIYNDNDLLSEIIYHYNGEIINHELLYYNDNLLSRKESYSCILIRNYDNKNRLINKTLYDKSNNKVIKDKSVIYEEDKTIKVTKDKYGTRIKTTLYNKKTKLPENATTYQNDKLIETTTYNYD